MSSELEPRDLKPTLRPVDTAPAERTVEERVRELERAIAAMLEAPAEPVRGHVVGASPPATLEFRWPSVDELEYFCWFCLAITCGTLALRACPQLLGALA